MRPRAYGPKCMGWRSRYIMAVLLLLGPCWAPVAAMAEVSALVQITPVRVMAMTNRLRAYGTVEFSPEGGQTLSLEAESLVSQVLVAAGQRVQKGEPLLRVAPTINDQLQMDQARIAVRFAADDLQRLKGLRDRQLATNAEVQAAAQNLARAKATLRDIGARLLTLQSGALRAPMNGVVESVTVHQGDLVPAGQPLLRLSKGDQLRVLLGVEPEDLTRVQRGDTVEIQPVYGGTTPVAGRVTQIYWQVDPKTRLAQVVVPVPANPALLPGGMVHARILVGQGQDLAIPDSAVLQTQGRSYCFVAVHGRAQRRWIETGWQEKGWIAVKKGLKAGDRVVSLGNYELHDGMALRVEGGQ